MRHFLAIIIAACCFPLPARAADDIVIADFEKETYDDWKTTGAAFGPGPARGTLPNQMPVTGYLGKRLVNSYHGGDKSTGTLTSPAFKIERQYVNFLIGGGKYPGETCINLQVDGKVVRTATGPNDRPGGSEELDWHSWDVADLAGKNVVIEIVDKRTGGWGHVNVDHIVMSDAPKKSGPVRREFVIDKTYLHLPVRTGAPMRRMKYLIDGQVVREFDIELADDPGFFVFSDVTAFRGKKCVIEVNKLPENSKAMEKIVALNGLPDAENLYREKLRPQFHFTARRGWHNDPNGLVYLDGEYHLFFQHNPYGWNWGNMHWGHAVSKDLIHWRELPEALYPKRYDDWCFSGSAVIDKKNTAGWKTGSIDVMVAAFTSTGRGECIVYSNDRGRTWTQYEANPVVKHAGRDPKLIWHEPTSRWIMALYDEFQGKQWIAFHSSPDLKKWTFESRIEGYFECPDLFELAVEKTGEKKWVLYAADGKYTLGQFDGHKFTVESGKHQLWHGNFYAAQTFDNTPDGRRIQIGWANGVTFPGMPFNQQMTIPVELTLRKTSDGVRMFAWPVKELDGLGKDWRQVMSADGAGIDPRSKELTGEPIEIVTDLEPADSSSEVLNIRGVPVTYDVKKQELSCRHVKAPLKLVNGHLQLRLFIDRNSIEIFANEGAVAISLGGAPDAKERLVRWLAIEGSPGRRPSVKARVLESAWRN